MNRLAAAVVSLALLPACSRDAASSAPARPAPTPRTAPAPVPSGRLVLTGELVPVRSSDVFVPQTNQWQMQVRWIENDGAFVKAGQRILEFDSATFASQLEEKVLAVEQLESELVRAVADVETQLEEKLLTLEQRKNAVERARVEAEIPEGIRARREDEDKRLALQKAEAERTKAEENLRAARTATDADLAVRRINLEKARRERDIARRTVDALTLVAPADGLLVIGEQPREHRKIQEGDTLWPGLLAARIPARAGMRVEAWLYDVDDGRLERGTRVVCTPDGEPDRPLPGTVEEIAPVAQETSRESLRRAQRVLVRLDRPEDAPLRPGQSVRVEAGPPPPAPPKAAAAAAAPPEELAARGTPWKVRRGDLVVGVEVTGTLRAVNTQSITAPTLPDVWEYRIAEMASEGSSVKAGEVVLRFDPSDLKQKLIDMEAERDSVRTSIERREVELAQKKRDAAFQRSEAEARQKKARLKVDVPPELVKATDLKISVLELALADFEVASWTRKVASLERSADAEQEALRRRFERTSRHVTEIEERIGRMAVTAPRDGTVLYVANWRDEKKKVGDSCWRGELVMEIPDLTRLVVRGEVDEGAAARLRPGAPVTLKLEAHPDVLYRGELATVGLTIQRLSPRMPRKVVRVEVSLAEIDRQKMRPGMRLRGSIETARSAGTLLVPAEAVFLSGSGAVVYRRGWRGVQAVPVTLGRRGERECEVRAGLAEGETILLPAA
ncbi:MAG TPA: HlyD family efflux transporter periplasmic adaptor subunit, partial [Thermoanaerobaculia bacterium]|nr:HlyD family efflux transporter periplasmic adaptor subunit [Thermoanaerobaculia bacterium]